MSRWAWSTSHQEFTIADHYYFWRLQRLLADHRIDCVPVERFDDLFAYDGIIFNYPEQPFTETERDRLLAYVERGGVIIALAYYLNEDHVAEILNPLLEPAGMRFRYDAVTDPVSNYEGDPYMVVTTRVHRYVSDPIRVMFACPCSVAILHADVVPVVQAEDTARSGERVESPICIAAERTLGSGRILAVGSCVFWDNFSIEVLDNGRWTLALLQSVGSERKGTMTIA